MRIFVDQVDDYVGAETWVGIAASCGELGAAEAVGAIPEWFDG